MGHVVEPAPTGRATCRGCGKPIEKDSLRFGERLPNAYGEGEMTLWFHPRCAAYKRPEPLLEIADDLPDDLATGDKDELVAIAEASTAHRRLPRLDAADRAPTGRARCRSCRELIAKDEWRVRLVFFEQGRFEASGYIHASCVADYVETTDVLNRLRRFSDIDDAAAAELKSALTAKQGDA